MNITVCLNSSNKLCLIFELVDSYLKPRHLSVVICSFTFTQDLYGIMLSSTCLRVELFQL